MKRQLIVMFCVSFIFGCATQQDAIYLDNRLSQLEIKSAKMEKILNVTAGEIDSKLANFGETKSKEDIEIRGQVASLDAKSESLKDELRNLSGRLDEIEHQLNQGTVGGEKTGAQLQEMVAYQNERLARLEKYLNLEPMEKKAMGSGPAVGMTTEKSPLISDDPSKASTDIDLYMVAKKAFDQGDYESSRQKFEDLLKMYPNSQRAENSQFWLGETYYQEKWYEKAILEYQKVIEKYPNGNKVAAALLKQGFSFLNLGDKNNARLIFRELVNKFPNSNEAAVAKKKLTEI